jgi:predicted nucleic acid-binding Zn ribbon protein
VFKGSGFYRTDSRNGSGSRSETANGKQPSESAAKSSESADKAAAKTSGETSPKPSPAAKEKVA